MRSNPKATPKQPEFAPAWLSFEVSQALDRIMGEDAAKKERTVLRLAQAIATGTPQNEIFRNHRQYGVCNKKYWTGFGSKPGWKDDPIIAHALDVATQRARWWIRVKEGKGIESALDVLMDAGEASARQLSRVAIEGRAQVTQSDGSTSFVEADVKDILKAADSVLDRIDKRTAAKNTTEVTGAVRTEQTIVHDLSRLSTDELKALRTIVAKAESDEAAGAG